MTSIKKIREIAKKDDKKLSKKAIKKINSMLEEKAEDIIRKAARKADFSGRKTIKQEDISYFLSD